MDEHGKGEAEEDEQQAALQTAQHVSGYSSVQKGEATVRLTQAKIDRGGWCRRFCVIIPGCAGRVGWCARGILNMQGGKKSLAFCLLCRTAGFGEGVSGSIGERIVRAVHAGFFKLP
ncbi:hypothetical protein DSM19430T_03040 [Desulfovibrio psychrotolerans]|uniref:Uncharacterized protein n=1 Tax=Desulfovibrio psychrotolerans TaxID=415242 RepID=A0A7J0BPP5_9BACT|nr:hypothetical protein DSM19430T_03040 [Desulfovibrio psychrotolerans]